MSEARDIGINVEEPEGVCEDDNCPFHGTLSVRGSVYEGEVKSDSMENTVTVQWSYSQKVPKYERYSRRNTRINAHNPNCINAKEGDRVKIAECRPLSKTKSFVVVEVMESGD